MNKTRRKEVTDIIARIERLAAGLRDAEEDLDEILADERDAYDNTPESLQDSDRGVESQEAITALEEAFSGVGEAAYQAEQVAAALADIAG